MGEGDVLSWDNVFLRAEQGEAHERDVRVNRAPEIFVKDPRY